MMHRRKLLNFWIHGNYQTRYVFWLAGVGILLFSCTAYLFYSGILSIFGWLSESAQLSSALEGELIVRLNRLLLRVAGTALFFVLTMVALGIFVSHKTAGAMMHFKRVFERLESGERGARVRLRQGDDFMDVAETFNRLADRLSEQSVKQKK